MAVPSSHNSPVGLLEARPRATTAKLFRLAAARICDNERPIISHEDVLDVLLRCLVNVLLVVCDDPLGNGLAHGIDLPSVATTLHAKANVNLLELVPEQQHRLVYLHAEDVRLHGVDWAAVHADLPGARAHERHGDCVLLPAEALHLLFLGALIVRHAGEGDQCQCRAAAHPA